MSGLAAELRVGKRGPDCPGGQMFGRRGGLVIGMLLILGVAAVGGLAGVSPLSLHAGPQVVALAEKAIHSSGNAPSPRGGYLRTSADYLHRARGNSWSTAGTARHDFPGTASRRVVGGYLVTRADARHAGRYHWARRSRWRTAAVVTAARPGVPSLGLLAGSGELAPVAGEYGFSKHTRLAVGEGLGPGWCLAFGGYPLGPSIDGVYACGPSLGQANVFDTDGFQCVELSTRFLWDVYRRVVRKVPDGADLVWLAHRQLHIPVGTPGYRRVPAPGDILSLSGPNADPNGHTAVVTAVNVDANGNGSIQVMEENGSLSGWDQLNVSHWGETFGDPRFDGGLYYYTDVSWLKLAPAPRQVRMAAPQGALRYAVQPLGGSTSEANGINDRRQIVGMTDGRTKDHVPIHRVFFSASGRSGSLTPPKGDEYLTRASGISPRGLIAAWSVHAGDDQPYPYVVSPGKRAIWTQLPALRKGNAVGEALGVDAAGDIAGWMVSPSGSSSLGVVWRRWGGKYHPRILWPNRYFHNPIVNAVDPFREAIGTETIGTSSTSGVFWAPSGRPFRLQPLAGHPVLDVPRAMYSRWIGDGRIVSIVGSSLTRTGVVQACLWQVWIHGGVVAVGRPTLLGQVPGYVASWATSVSSAGWIVGGLGQAPIARGAFIWRPTYGMVDLNRLLAPGSHWRIVAVHTINGAGDIVGEGYQTRAGGESRVHGVLLVPTAGVAAPKS